MPRNSDEPRDARPLRAVFCPWAHDNPYQQSLAEGLRRLGCVVDEGSASAWFLRRSPTTQAADVVHFHWLDPYLLAGSWAKSLLKSLVFLAQLWLCRWRGKRIVWTAHNLTSHEASHPRLQSFFSRRVFAASHRVLAHGETCGRLVAENFGGDLRKVRVVPHANYLDDYPQEVSPDEARRVVGAPDDAFVYLFVGSIRGYKGVGELIETFGKLDRPDARLIVAGKAFTDELAEELRQLADATPGASFHHGFVERDAMQNYLGAADVVVLPYRKILTSGTLLLAASFGRVAIVPDAPSLLDTIDPRGVLPFDRDDPDALLEAMRAAYDQRATLAARGAASQQEVAKWGWPEMAAATLRVYRGDDSEEAPPSR